MTYRPEDDPDHNNPANGSIVITLNPCEPMPTRFAACEERVVPVYESSGGGNNQVVELVYQVARKLQG